MGLLDGMDLSSLDPELRKLLMSQPQDSKAPLNAGLMAAGLGMLMNAHKGAAGGIGAGGLLGLDAYNQERMRQQKDPMAQINLLNGVMGLQGNIQKNQWMRDFSGQGQAATVPYSRESGLPADAPQVAPPMQSAPQGGQMPLSKIIQGMMLGMPGAKELYDASIKQPGKYGPGDVPGSVNPMTGKLEMGQQIPNLDKGMEMGPDGAQPIRNYPQSAALIAGATKGAEADAAERAKAALDIVAVPDGKGGTISMPRTQAVALLNGQQQKSAVPPAMEAAYADWIKSGSPEGRFRFTPPQGQIGVGQTAAQAAQAMIPAEVEKAKALAEPALAQGAQSGANTDFVTNEYRPAMAKAQNSRQTLAGLDVIEKMDMKTGWGTTAKAYGARVLEGIGMAPPQARELAADSTSFNQVLNTEMWRLLGEQKGPQTEGDAARAKATFANLDSPEAANKLTLAIHRAMHNQNVEKAKFYSSNFAKSVKGGNPYELEAEWQQRQKSLFDDPALSKFKAVGKTQAAPSPAEVEAEIKRRGL